jgi:murein DD-endopeptidase MepM/ murein hydrolase activator NlpD
VPSYATPFPTGRRPAGRRSALPRLALAAGVAALLLVGGAALLRVSDGDPRWWLLNDSPPVVVASAPNGPNLGSVVVDVAVRPAGRAALTATTLDGAPWPLPPPVTAGDGRPQETQRLEIDTTALPDGRHVLRLEAADRSMRRLRSGHEVAFTSDNTPPRLDLQADAGRLRAGVPIVVHWGADEPADLAITWGGEAVPGIDEPGGPPGAGHYFSLVAVPVETAAGETSLRLAGRDGAGNAADRATSLPVEAVTLPRQDLSVPPALAALATGPVARDEASQVATLTRPVSAERRWTGAFRVPLPGAPPRTTGFGDRRDYPDGYVVYHAGYDLAAPAGTPVGAAAGGQAVFAAPLPQRGNTVILDHGWGVYTVYAHLLVAEVEVGQHLGPGEELGRVGSTGLSTGPHLHWEVRLRGLPVDPGAWVELSGTLAG